MATEPLVNLVGPAGQLLRSSVDDTDQTPQNPQQTWHSVASIFHTIPASPAALTHPIYVYGVDHKAHKINMSKYKSTCEVTFEDDTKKEIADWDGQYGISTNTNVDGYDFILVLDEPDRSQIPTAGNYIDDKVVLFSGYDRATYDLDTNKRVAVNYVGIEEITNEIKMVGIVEVNHILSFEGKFSGPISPDHVRYYNKRLVFNEGSAKDRYSGVLEVETKIVDKHAGPTDISQTKMPVHDKSGIGDAEHWNCKQILDYIVGVFMNHNLDVRRLLDQKDRIKFVSNFIRFDMASIKNSDLHKVTPMNFDLNGLGFMEAIYKILDKSRLYSVVKQYQADGVAVIGLRANSKAQRLADNSSFVPTKILIGEADAADDAANNHESSNIKLNRENKSIGRVEVVGGHLWINTLLTSWFTHPVTPNASKNRETNDPAANSSSFSDHINLMAVDYTESKTGIPAQLYNAMNERMLDHFLGADAGITIAEFNETIDQRLFTTAGVVQIKPNIFKPYSNSKARDLDDMVIYAALPVERSNGVSSALSNDAGDEFYFIQPIVGTNEDDWKLAAKYSAGLFGAFIIYAGADKDKTDSGEHRFKEYIDSSTVPPPTTYPANRGVITKEIPLYIRCAVKTQYRIKGVAEIAGYDPRKHSIKYVSADQAIDIAIQYKDKEYDGEGGWTNLTDGYIDGVGLGEQLALNDLNTEAESVLLKFSSIANSGFTTENGVISSIMVGDIIDEFVDPSGARSFDFEALISHVTYDLIEKFTGVNYGPIE